MLTSRDYILEDQPVYMGRIIISFSHHSVIIDEWLFLLGAYYVIKQVNKPTTDNRA